MLTHSSGGPGRAAARRCTACCCGRGAPGGAPSGPFLLLSKVLISVYLLLTNTSSEVYVLLS